jgi:chorismate mutase
MAKAVDATLQDANVLRAVVEKYKEQLSGGGFPQEDIERFYTVIEELSGKLVTASQAKEIKKMKTETQNAAMAKGVTLLQKVKDAAKSVFTKSKAVRAEFHVGVKQPTTVGGMLSELKYIKTIAEKYKADVGKRGVTDALLQKLSNCIEELQGADVVQEQSKKEQKSATRSREDALQELKVLMKSIRTTAGNIFDDESILEEFGTIFSRKKSSTLSPSKAKMNTGGGGTEPTSPSAPK